MDRRLLNALKQPNAWPKVQGELSIELHELNRKRKEIDSQIEEFLLWKAFHESEHKTEYGEFRLYEIDDGETHTVAAKSADDALKFYTNSMGYETPSEAMEDLGEFEVTELPPERGMAIRDVDEGGWVGIKTHAEWADVSEEALISTTAY